MYSPMICDVQSRTLAQLGAGPVSLPGACQHDSRRSTGYAHVVSVQPIGDGADWAANGAALRAALCDALAGPYRRCLVRLAAGVYDLGTAPLRMRAYIDLEGAGELRTRLLSRVRLNDGGTIVGADYAELRCLSVANAGGGECAVAIYNDAVAEWQADSGGRLFPQAFLPFWDIDATLKEARRVVEELHLTGVTMTDKPEVFDLPDYGQPIWNPLWELINEMKEDYTIAIVTHNMQQAARVSDETAFMYLGELVEFDSTSKIFTTPADRRTQD